MLEFKIIRSSRKTVAIQIKSDGEIVVRCPVRMREEEIHRLVKSKQSWILKNISNRKMQKSEGLNECELEKLRNQAKELIPQRVAHYASLMGVTYQRITIRAQKTRWGSCSSKGNLNFNCLLALVPADVLDYVVVHELCHLIELNHSERFWGEVRRILPNYAQSKLWLKEYGSALIARL